MGQADLSKQQPKNNNHDSNPPTGATGYSKKREVFSNQ